MYLPTYCGTFLSIPTEKSKSGTHAFYKQKNWKCNNGEMSDIFCTTLKVKWFEPWKFCLILCTNKQGRCLLHDEWRKTLKQCWPKEPQTLCKHSTSTSSISRYMTSLDGHWFSTYSAHSWSNPSSGTKYVYLFGYYNIGVLIWIVENSVLQAESSWVKLS